MVKKDKSDGIQDAGLDKNTDTSQDDGKQEPTLTDGQWETAFKHSRFKSLNERATKAEKELAKLTKKAKEADEKKLKDDNKWQELAEKKGKEVEALNVTVTLASKTRSVIEEAIKLGIKDTDAATKLIELKDIELDEDGKPTNAAEIVKALAKAKPYLITGEPAKNIGADVNPDATEGQKRVWKSSELREKMRDAKWFRKHKKEIDEAHTSGRVDYTK